MGQNRNNIHYQSGSLFIKALTNLAGQYPCKVVGDDAYENIVEWYVENPPTEAEVNAEWQRLKDEWTYNAYKRERSIDYPPLADFADAYYWAQKGDTTKMDAYIAKCEEVKTNWPKPE